MRVLYDLSEVIGLMDFSLDCMYWATVGVAVFYFLYTE